MRLARGQALLETVIFLPLTLLTLWAVIWVAQYGVMSERVQSAVRYSGLVSNQINPYVEYSLYVLYNSLGPVSSNAPIPASTCNAPTTDALTNSGTYPGPTTAPFWMATPIPPSVTCSAAQSQVAAFTGLNQTALALSNTPIVQAADHRAAVSERRDAVRKRHLPTEHALERVAELHETGRHVDADDAAIRVFKARFKRRFSRRCRRPRPARRRARSPSRCRSRRTFKTAAASHRSRQNAASEPSTARRSL